MAVAPAWPRTLRHAAFVVLTALAVLDLLAASIPLGRGLPLTLSLGLGEELVGLALLCLALFALGVQSAWAGFVRRNQIAILRGLVLLLVWSGVIALFALAGPMFPDAEAGDKPDPLWALLAVIGLAWVAALAGLVGVAKDPRPAR